MGKSIIGRLPGKGNDFGPVAGVSFRVASRIANSLRAGQAAREPADLNHSRIILFHAPAEQSAALLQVLLSAQIDWTGKSLIVCDCEADAGLLSLLRQRGAHIASAREFGLPGYLAIQGNGQALAVAHRLARDLRMKAIEIPDGAEHAFAAAVTLATGAFTPLLDQVAALLRHAGVRETEAPRLAAALFQTTAADYIHSGKQSWSWYVQGPKAERLDQEIAAAARMAGASLAETLEKLILLGMDVYDKHRDVAEALSAATHFPSRDREGMVASSSREE